jgi:hypothetical protein
MAEHKEKEEHNDRGSWLGGVVAGDLVSPAVIATAHTEVKCFVTSGPPTEWWRAIMISPAVIATAHTEVKFWLLASLLLALRFVGKVTTASEAGWQRPSTVSTGGGEHRMCSHFPKTAKNWRLSCLVAACGQHRNQAGRMVHWLA